MTPPQSLLLYWFSIIRILPELSHMEEGEFFPGGFHPGDLGAYKILAMGPPIKFTSYTFWGCIYPLAQKHFGPYIIIILTFLH